MNTVTVHYGADSFSHTFSGTTTVGAIVGNSTVKAVLGYGDNVKALVGGVEQSHDTQISGGSLTIETKANSKA